MKNNQIIIIEWVDVVIYDKGNNISINKPNMVLS